MNDPQHSAPLHEEEHQTPKARRYRTGKGAGALFPSWIPIHSESLSFEQYCHFWALRLSLLWRSIKSSFWCSIKDSADICLVEAALIEDQIELIENSEKEQWSQNQYHSLRQDLLDALDEMYLTLYDEQAGDDEHRYPEIVLVMAESMEDNSDNKETNAELMGKARLICDSFKRIRALIKESSTPPNKAKLSSVPELKQALKTFNSAWCEFKSSRSGKIQALQDKLPIKPK